MSPRDCICSVNKAICDKLYETNQGFLLIHLKTKIASILILTAIEKEYDALLKKPFGISAMCTFYFTRRIQSTITM